MGVKKTATKLPHIFLVDIDDSGIEKEVAIMKEDVDGTIYYIDVAMLHPLDKQRLKKVITSVHADKYPLWELMSQSKISNGMNALDFFHNNYVKTKRPRGARPNPADSLLNVSPVVNDTLIGSQFTNPAEATLDPNSKLFEVGQP